MHQLNKMQKCTLVPLTWFPVTLLFPLHLVYVTPLSPHSCGATLLWEVQLLLWTGKQQHNRLKHVTILLLTLFHPPHRWGGEAAVTLWGWALVRFGSDVS